MESKKYTLIEKKWIELLLSTEFVGKKILVDQFENASVERDYNEGYFSLKFYVDREQIPFQYEGRVPIEMHAFPENKAPIVFLLHVIQGYIDELEIFNADSSPFSPDITFKEFTLLIDESLKIV